MGVYLAPLRGIAAGVTLALTTYATAWRL